MSSRKIRFSPEAIADIDGLLEFTAETWGVDQQTLYGGELIKALDLLKEFPGRGSVRDDISPGVYSLLIGHHIAFYRYDSELVRIIRILHERQNPAVADWSRADDDY